MQKYLRWKDALDHYNRMLDDVVKDAKPVNSDYQKYLLANPYKKRKIELEKLREKYTARIIELSKQGMDKYDGK